MNESLTTNLIECSFCEKSQSDVDTMIRGPGENICDECVANCTSLIKAENFRSDGTSSCSFCSKNIRVVNKSANGSDGCICEDCIELCNEIVEERRWRKEGFAFCSFFVSVRSVE